MTKTLKKEIEENQKLRKEYIKENVLKDIDAVVVSMIKKLGTFKKFVLVGESPWNDGEDQYHRLLYSFGYISDDGEDYDDSLENCTLFSAVFDDFIDEKYHGCGGVWEYINDTKDNNETHLSLSNIKEQDAKPFAEILDALCREVKSTNFILTITPEKVDFDLDHDCE